MHSFEVDTRIYQPENSDVHRDEPKVNITFRRLTTPDIFSWDSFAVSIFSFQTAVKVMSTCPWLKVQSILNHILTQNQTES